MKLAIAFLLPTFFAMVLSSPPHPCQCWPDWNPVQEGNDWHCKDPYSEKTFQCNIEKPPVCTCKVNLPIGEVNCAGNGNDKKYDSLNCESNSDWEAWFNKNPQYRLHH